MPCSDQRLWTDNVPEWKLEELAEMERRLNTVTDLLCQAGRAYVQDSTPPLAVRKWWSEHRKRDARRKEPWPKGKRPLLKKKGGAG